MINSRPACKPMKVRAAHLDFFLILGLVTTLGSADFAAAAGFKGAPDYQHPRTLAEINICLRQIAFPHVSPKDLARPRNFRYTAVHNTSYSVYNGLVVTSLSYPTGKISEPLYHIAPNARFGQNIYEGGLEFNKSLENPQLPNVPLKVRSNIWFSEGVQSIQKAFGFSTAEHLPSGNIHRGPYFAATHYNDTSPSAALFNAFAEQWNSNKPIRDLVYVRAARLGATISTDHNLFDAWVDAGAVGLGEPGKTPEITDYKKTTGVNRASYARHDGQQLKSAIWISPEALHFNRMVGRFWKELETQAKNGESHRLNQISKQKLIYLDDVAKKRGFHYITHVMDQALHFQNNQEVYQLHENLTNGALDHVEKYLAESEDWERAIWSKYQKELKNVAAESLKRMSNHTIWRFQNWPRLYPNASNERNPTIAGCPPESSSMWKIWMAQEPLPTLIVAIKRGLFEVLYYPKTMELIAQDLNISERTARVFVDSLRSLGLISHNTFKKTYAVTHYAPALLKIWPDKTKITEFVDKLMQYTKIIGTPEEYLAAMKHPRTLPSLHYPISDSYYERVILEKIINAVFSLPTLYVANKLKIFNFIYSGKNQTITVALLNKKLKISKDHLHDILLQLSDDKMIIIKRRKAKQKQRLYRRLNGSFVEGLVNRDLITLTSAAATYAMSSDNQPYDWSGILNLMAASPTTVESLLQAWQNENDGLSNVTNEMMERVQQIESARVFAAHMNSQGADLKIDVKSIPAIKNSKALLDVAGGGGATYSLAVGLEYPDKKIFLMELDPTTEVAKESVETAGLSNQIQVVEGNMFEPLDWPKQKNIDTILLSFVIHDWSLEKIEIILQNAYDTLTPGGQLVLHDVFLKPLDRFEQPDQIVSSFSTLLFRFTEGRHYSFKELDPLFSKIGFGFIESVETNGPSQIWTLRKQTN